MALRTDLQHVKQMQNLCLSDIDTNSPSALFRAQINHRSNVTDITEYDCAVEEIFTKVNEKKITPVTNFRKSFFVIKKLN